MKRDQHEHSRQSGTLAILAGLTLFMFGLLWELRWRRLVRALSRRAEIAELWAERALHDPLTNLPNRTLLQDRIEQALFRAERTQTHVALLFIDLDDFKDVNDEHGHLVGDQMLIAAGDRFRQHLRASDTAARLGGDEFVILLEGNTTSRSVLTVAERLRMALHVPLLIEPDPLTLTASIGVAVSRAGSEHPDDLLRKADHALLAAKRQGKDQVVLAEMEESAVAGGHFVQSRPNGRLPEHYERPI